MSHKPTVQSTGGRRFALVAGLLSCLLSAACDSPRGAVEPGLEELAADFREANQASEVEPMLELYHLEGVDERTVSLLKGALEYELGLPISHIVFEPLSGAPEETIDFVHDDTSYGPSLEPKRRMRVVYASENNFTSLFTVGETEDGEWRIVCARPRPEVSYQP